MRLREQLEYAAKACGHTLADEYFFKGDVRLPPKGQEHIHDSLYWNPLTDQADSDRMGAKLRIDTCFFDGYVSTGYADNKDLSAARKHNNTDEDVCRAVREARLAVAVEIGRMK